MHMAPIARVSRVSASDDGAIVLCVLHTHTNGSSCLYVDSTCSCVQVKAVAVGQSRAPCTHTLRNTVNPVWNDDTVFATVHVAPDGPEHVLDDCHVIVTCMDEEAVTSDVSEKQGGSDASS